MPYVVVLLGPPASGKSTVGDELRVRGFRWREWEMAILDRWGSRENFVANKAVALPALQAEIRSWIGAGGATAVIESTGLSDAAFLDALEREVECLVVRLDVSDAEARRRLTSRPAGCHLTDDLDGNARVRREFDARVLPTRRVDLVVDTDGMTAREVAALIAAVAAP